MLEIVPSFPAETNKESPIDNVDVFFAKADADLGVADVYAAYYASQEKNHWTQSDFDIWGVGVNVPIDQFRVFGEYWKNSTTPDGAIFEDTAWNAGVGYGKRDLAKVGSWQLDVAYNDIGNGVYLGGTGLQTDILDTLAGGGKSFFIGKNAEVKFWNAIAEVTLMQNMYLHAEYAFAAEGEGPYAEDPDDTWTVSLNYVF